LKKVADGNEELLLSCKSLLVLPLI
jgi:hypothetical protein